MTALTLEILLGSLTFTASLMAFVKVGFDTPFGRSAVTTVRGVGYRLETDGG